MEKTTNYISVYKRDFVWHNKTPNTRLSRKSCKRLSIPKYVVSKIKCKDGFAPWKN